MGEYRFGLLEVNIYIYLLILYYMRFPFASLLYICNENAPKSDPIIPDYEYQQ